MEQLVANILQGNNFAAARRANLPKLCPWNTEARGSKVHYNPAPVNIDIPPSAKLIAGGSEHAKANTAPTGEVGLKWCAG